MSATAVEVRDIVKRFGQAVALDDVSLGIPHGDYAVLLGPSGSGKTTLLSILGGFLAPDAGEVRIAGEDVSAVPPAKRPTATVFQDYALFPHMSVAANVGFGLRMRGAEPRVRDERVRAMLALVGLADTAARKPHQLSGGQRQRVALARALAVSPSVLLLDEPLGALDLKLRRQMQEELKRIQREVGTTFIHVTHDQEEAMAIGDSVIVMNAGRIEDSGAPERVYLKPRTRFVADFMGQSSMLDGRVLVAGEDVLVVGTKAGSLEITAVNAADFTVGDAVSLSFGPEHLATAGAPGLQPLGEVEIEAVSFMGTFHQARARHRSDPRFRPIVMLPQSAPARPGARLMLWVGRDTPVPFRSA